MHWTNRFCLVLEGREMKREEIYLVNIEHLIRMVCQKLGCKHMFANLLVEHTDACRTFREHMVDKFEAVLGDKK